MRKPLALLLIFLLLPLCATAAEAYTITPLEDSEIPPTPQGITHYLIICTDSWHYSVEEADQTDGLMLLTLDSVGHRVMLTSFIRDLLVRRPDGKYGRITNLINNFPLEALIDTINSHFGLRIENYVFLNWTGVESIIDAAGGVDITVTSGESIRLKDKTAYSPSWTDPVLSGEGTYHFTGYAAVIYMRIRSGTTVDGENWDFRRTTRARNVISSIAQSLTDASYDDALRLLDAATACIGDTNLSAAQILDALNTAYSLRDTKIEQFRIPAEGTYEELHYDADRYSQPIDYEANREALHAFLYDNFVVIDGE